MKYLAMDDSIDTYDMIYRYCIQQARASNRWLIAERTNFERVVVSSRIYSLKSPTSLSPSLHSSATP